MWSIPVTIAFSTIRIGNDLNTLTMQFDSDTNLKEHAVALSLIPERIGSGLDPLRIRIPGTENSVSDSNALTMQFEFVTNSPFQTAEPARDPGRTERPDRIRRQERTYRSDSGCDSESNLDCD